MYKISLITGDGIGPELSESAISVLDAIHDKLDLKFDVTKLSAGDKALEETGKALPDETIDVIKQSDACMKAPVGESAADVIVVLRRMLDLYANIRPAKSYPHMPALRDDIDMVIVRENTEDLYTGKEFSVGDSAVALRIISEKASKRIAKYAFETAKRRDSMRKVTCVHKSNVMRVTDGLFAKSCNEVSKEYPDIIFEEMYVDACAMNLIRQPEQFDVIVTTNLFGDILSDESSQVVGGLGMAPAANIGDSFALFEPVHGAAFDIAGQNIANPSSFLLSIKMMCDWLGSKNNHSKCIEVGEKLEATIFDLVKSGMKTKDIGGTMSTTEFTKQITDNL
ncbi:MAG: isocitrate/isopropylmalate dehydrogenase family protein [Nitrosopumilus sp.]|uniref:isocitrate/isopropylmalate dehydrogenase family protein n=1 Tax=Nitrosopumilus sp. TaxID=2024843 RepID=UPI00247D2D97|nr:isocitrate/isopropylmalate dehydrogenase family protein [Nitrosopumilus sp.]MCV0392494.1 isocitrate/isopropylmalate dehydrogenase family protein [Nitrosopumilus sp.]